MRLLCSILLRPACPFLLLAVLMPFLSSCEPIWDNEDCGTEYRVKFKYDYNMLYTDAFATQVHSVTLYAFDADGRLAFQRSEQGEALARNDYSMALDVDPGQYHLVAWAGLFEGKGFTVPTLTEGQSTIDDLYCRINREEQFLRNRPVDAVDYRLQTLWHGYLPAQTLTRAASRTAYLTLPLTRDTHTLRIILQQMSGEAMDAELFEISVTDRNGFMRYDNTLDPADGMLTYLPYYQQGGSADIEGSATPGEAGVLNMCVAEMTVGRLMADADTRLTVTRRDNGVTVLSIPLINYLELCRTVANYHMPLQEYLDREDHFAMTFFLDEDNAWINTQVIINDWIVRFNDITPGM